MSSNTNNDDGAPPQAPIVMVVEDDALIRKAVGRMLQAAGYEVILVPTAADALIVTQRMQFHVLVLDLSLVDVDPFAGIHEGFAVLDWLERQMGEFKFRVVIYTSQGSQHFIEKAEAKGVFAFCIKRRDMSNLRQCVDDAVKSLKAA